MAAVRRPLLLAALTCLALSASALQVAVTGATGRVGRLVVQRLLDDGHGVTAVVRDTAKAAEVLPPAAAAAAATCDLATCDTDGLSAACAGADALIWCATGFTESGESIDMRGMAALPPAFVNGGDAAAAGEAPPRVVMLSSAGVTRPGWDEAKKEKLVGAADIPIIRLNPGGILGKKLEAEDMLRGSGARYCVVRPTGLKFEGWPRGRVVLSQGDVAVGRTHPEDLADTLVAALDAPEATGKTFELFTLAGYPPPRELAPALARLARDDGASGGAALDEAAVAATYDALQQLLPGEEQDATKLEMGRTYEQVDAGAVAPRERGAAPTERERAVAAGVAPPSPPHADNAAPPLERVKGFLKKVFA